MANATTSMAEQIHALLASKRYSVSETGEGVFRIQEVESGITLQAVLAGDILYLSVLCMTAPQQSLTPEVMRKMLSSENGIATSHFRLVEAGFEGIAITLNNFCKLQDMGMDDEDDILSCVSFLLADVVHAKELLGADLHSA